MKLVASLLVLSSSLVAMATSPVAKNEVEGVWRSPCKTTKEAIVQLKATFSEKGFSVESRAFEDAACATAHLAVTISGDYVLGATKTSPKAYDYREIDYKLQHISFEPLSEAIAEVLNQSGFCGFDDWKMATARDLTGVDCQGTKFPKKGDAFYGAARTDKKQLWLSAITLPTKGTSYEKKDRPDTIDERFPLDLQ